MQIRLEDFLSLIHPILAVTVVFPLLGMVVNMAWQTRQRRLQIKADVKSRIPPGVGPEHLKLGSWFSGAVVGVALIAMSFSIFIKSHLLEKDLTKAAFLGGLVLVTIGTLVCLYKAEQKHWRAIFATLTGAGLVLLGCQNGVYQRTDEWFISHYYYGITAALLMVFSLAIFPDIYQDRSNRWRLVHIILNCFALLLFIGEGVTGARDLLDIPLSWQLDYVYQCDWKAQTCPTPPK